MNEDEPNSSFGSTSHQNGSSPFAATRGATNEFNDYDQQRGEGNLSESETLKDKKAGIFPSKKDTEALKKAKKKQKKLQQRYQEAQRNPYMDWPAQHSSRQLDGVQNVLIEPNEDDQENDQENSIYFTNEEKLISNSLKVNFFSQLFIIGNFIFAETMADWTHITVN